ncbi:MAG: ParA family protein [candidate division Zixibacteria bacterium]|nr:ParA family protein [Candidatus Tariuqbacter arcticus]
MGRVIAITNQKGGVGKTTTAVNLSAMLAAAERKILLIDIDPQSNATSGLGINGKKLEKSVYEVLIDQVPIEEIIIDSELSYLKIAPSNIKLVGAEIELVNWDEREFALRNAISEVREKFEYIFIDCPPSLGLLTINTLTAADSVLIPIQCEYYALEGLTQLLNTIRLVQKHLNTNLMIEGVLLTMYDPRLNLSKQVLEDVQLYFEGRVFKSIIHRNVRLSEAPSHGKPILLYDVNSRGSQNYKSLAEEILAVEE